MRVCLVCRSPLGGASTQARYLLRHLSARGHSVAMVTQRDPFRAFRDGAVYRVPVPPAGGGFRPLPWAATAGLLAAGAAAAVYRHRATILHAMEVSASGVAGLIASRAVPAVTMLRFGGSLVFEAASRLRPSGLSPGESPERAALHPSLAMRMVSLLQARYLETYDFLIPNSEPTAGLLRRLGAPPERIRVVPNGVDTEMFSPRSVPRLFEGPTLLAGGRFEPWKGFDLLLRAVAKVRPGFPDLRVVFVGRGVDEARLRGLARELGLGEQVAFRPPVPREELPGLLGAVDGVVVPEYSNVGVSNLLMEAMACGRPVVSSSTPGVREFLRPGRSGLLFEPGDAEGLAEGLRALLGDPGLRDRLGGEARSLVAERFSIRAAVERTLEVYREAEALFEERWL